MVPVAETSRGIDSLIIRETILLLDLSMDLIYQDPALGWDTPTVVVFSLIGVDKDPATGSDSVQYSDITAVSLKVPDTSIGSESIGYDKNATVTLSVFDIPMATEFEQIDNIIVVPITDSLSAMESFILNTSLLLGLFTFINAQDPSVAVDVIGFPNLDIEITDKPSGTEILDVETVTVIQNTDKSTGIDQFSFVVVKTFEVDDLSFGQMENIYNNVSFLFDFSAIQPSTFVTDLFMYTATPSIDVSASLPLDGIIALPSGELLMPDGTIFDPEFLSVVSSSVPLVGDLPEAVPQQ